MWSRLLKTLREFKRHSIREYHPARAKDRHCCSFQYNYLIHIAPPLFWISMLDMEFPKHTKERFWFPGGINKGKSWRRKQDTLPPNNLLSLIHCCLHPSHVSTSLLILSMWLYKDFTVVTPTRPCHSFLFDNYEIYIYINIYMHSIHWPPSSLLHWW